jgi:VWFA-related protein
VGFHGEAEGFIGVGFDEKANIVVNVGGFGAASGDGMGVNVKNAAVEQGFEAGEAGFFADFAEGVGEDVRVPVAMAAGLEPEAEFGVVGEEGAGSGGVDHPGGGGDVAGLEGSGEAVGVGADEGEETVAHLGFVGVPGGVSLEGCDEIFPGWHGIGYPGLQSGLIVEAAPEVPGGDGAPGAPGSGEGFHVGGVRGSGEGPGAADGIADPEVAGGEDIGAAEGEDEKHVGGPDADAPDGGQMGDDIIVGHRGEGAEADFAGGGAAGQVVEGGALGGGEAAGAELFGGEGGDEGGGDPPGVGGGAEAGPDSGGGASAQLLGDDGAGEGGENGGVVVDGERSGAVDEGAEDGVGVAEVLDGGMHGNGKPRGCIHKYAMVLRMADRLSILPVLTALLLAVPGLGQTPPAGPPDDDTPVIRVDVELVNLFFSARERKGNYVAGLEAGDFEVLEDGKRQEIKFFGRETDLPLTLGLLVDVSRSQESLIETEKRASLRFFEQVLRPKDMAFIISFGSDTELLQDYTSSAGLLRRGLEQLRVSGGVGGVYTPSTVPGGGRGTVLYDAVWLAAKDKLRREVGRKAIVLITDGVDVGSRVKMGEAIEEAQRSDAIIYTILFEDPRYTNSYFGGASGEGAMKRMAEETGGRLFRVDRRNTLEQIYAQIAEEMRTQYVLGFTSSNPNKDGTFRRVEIKPKDRNIRIQARKGYYAGAD